jgi:hypothetical protein
MQPAFFDRITEKLQQLEVSEYTIITTERSIRDLYKGWMEVEPKEFMDSIFVRNSAIDGLVMKFAKDGIFFTMYAVYETVPDAAKI